MDGFPLEVVSVADSNATGQLTIRLHVLNVEAGSPGAALFTVPVDYQVTEYDEDAFSEGFGFGAE
jgi:hypothetical protein